MACKGVYTQGGESSELTGIVPPVYGRCYSFVYISQAMVGASSKNVEGFRSQYRCEGHRTLSASESRDEVTETSRLSTNVRVGQYDYLEQITDYPGRRDKNSATLGLNFSGVRTLLSGEIVRRRKHKAYVDMNMGNITDSTPDVGNSILPDTRGIKPVALASQNNRLVSLINEKRNQINNFEGSWGNRGNITQASETISRGDMMMANKYRIFATDLRKLVQDCICYSDCAVYYKCACYNNCGCNYG